jgi:hypothetical protein
VCDHALAHQAGYAARENAGGNHRGRATAARTRNAQSSRPIFFRNVRP